MEEATIPECLQWNAWGKAVGHWRDRQQLSEGLQRGLVEALPVGTDELAGATKVRKAFGTVGGICYSS
jgi:hypothetical protein